MSSKWIDLPVSRVSIVDDSTNTPLVINPDGSINVDITAIGPITLTYDTNYGVVGPNTLRTAAEIGNATGAAAFNSGTTNAQVLRVVLPTDQTAIPVTQGTSPWVVSGTVTANAGTGNFTVVQPSGANLHVDVDNFPAIQPISGTVTANQGTSPWVVSGTVLVNQGTSPWVISGTVIANAGSGTFLVDGSAHTQPVSGTVTALQGTSPWVVSGTVTTSPNVNVHDGTGVSISSTGNSLNVDVTNTVPVSQSGAPWSENITQIGGAALAFGQQLAASSIPVVTQGDLSPATQNITTRDLVSVTTPQANGQNYITGTPTAGSVASFSLSSFDSVEVFVTGTWTGTLQSEISLDGGVTWFTRGVKQAGAAYISSSFTANFAGGLNFSGMNFYRVRSTAAMTGTATVKVVASINIGSITVSNPLTLRDATTQSITNTIKAASTAAIATDTALVVALSPNSPIPAGTNSIGSVVVAENMNPWYQSGEVSTASTTQTVVMKTAFQYLTADQVVFIDSSSANDTLAGTGAQKVTFTYFKADGSGPFTATVNMTGTAFITGPSMSIIQSAFVSQVGSGGTNAGNITFNILGAPFGSICIIGAGDNETYFAHHIVPLGKTAFITNFSYSSTATAAGQGGKFMLKKRAIPLPSNAILNTIGTMNLVGTTSTENILFPEPVIVVGPAILFTQLVPDSATANTFTAALGGYEQ